MPKTTEDLNNPIKRSPFSVEIMGITVSYPQYLRLKLLQEKAVKLDRVCLDKFRFFFLERSPSLVFSDECYNYDSFVSLSTLLSWYAIIPRLTTKQNLYPQLVSYLRSKYTPEVLAQDPQLKTLVSLHNSLKKVHFLIGDKLFRFTT